MELIVILRSRSKTWTKSMFFSMKMRNDKNYQILFEDALTKVFVFIFQKRNPDCADIAMKFVIVAHDV